MTIASNPYSGMIRRLHPWIREGPQANLAGFSGSDSGGILTVARQPRNFTGLPLYAPKFVECYSVSGEYIAISQ